MYCCILFKIKISHFNQNGVYHFIRIGIYDISQCYIPMIYPGDSNLLPSFCTYIYLLFVYVKELKFVDTNIIFLENHIILYIHFWLILLSNSYLS